MTVMLIFLFSAIAFTVGFYAGRSEAQIEPIPPLLPEKVEVIKFIEPPSKTLVEEIEDARQKLKVSNLTVEEAAMAKAKLEPMLKYVTAIKYNQPKEEI